jgi:biopolymer transport protein TolR
MRKQSAYMSDINVTPFVDVMLVLLVIFMITAPLMQQGVDINLPRESTTPVVVKDIPTVTLKSDRSIFWNKEEAANIAALTEKLNVYVSESENGAIYFRADKSLDYGYIMMAMAAIRRAGVQNIGMMTEPML